MVLVLLASIAIPMVLDAIRGKGVGRRAPRLGKGGPRIGMAPPPFIGTWGKGKKKALIKRPTFKKTVPMSNFDLLEWCKYLKIPINNVLSRDQRVAHNNKLGLFIYNLEPQYMSGSH